jgi:hypothetical protein
MLVAQAGRHSILIEDRRALIGRNIGRKIVSHL